MPPHGPHHPPHHGPPHPPEPPRRPGRPPSVGADTPLNVKISQAELMLLDESAARLSVSRAEAVRQGLRLLQEAVAVGDGPALPGEGPPSPMAPQSRPNPALSSFSWPNADEAGVAASADGLYSELNTAPVSITRGQLEILLQSVLLATGSSPLCLYLLDCLRLHALAAGGTLASPEAAARFAGLIQSRGSGKGGA